MGDAATPALPDFTAQTASAYKSNIDAGFAVADRLAWAFAPHEEAAPLMTLRVESGALFDGIALAEVAAQSTGTIAAPTVDPRIDRVVIDALSGAVSVVTGAEAPAPSPPAIPAGKLPIAQVALVLAQTEIVNGDITDERQYQPAPSTGFAAGTKMLFQQATAPTGWTKDAIHDNKALRVVTGTPSSGGATAFTSVFGAGKTTGNASPGTPSHTHPQQHFTASSNTKPVVDATGKNTSATATGVSTQAAGGGSSHNHTFSLDLQYVDLIIATKD